MPTIKDEMGIWQNKSLTTLSSTELIPIAYFYAERGHEKDTFFCDFTNWPLSSFNKIFLATFLTSTNKRCEMQQSMAIIAFKVM